MANYLQNFVYENSIKLLFAITLDLKHYWISKWEVFPFVLEFLPEVFKKK